MRRKFYHQIKQKLYLFLETTQLFLFICIHFSYVVCQLFFFFNRNILHIFISKAQQDT